MKTKWVATVCITVLVSQAAAQTTRPAGGAGTWVGEITGENVYVRSTADEEGYECMKLSKPARVTVVGKAGDRLKILPPPGAFSIVAKTYVKVDATGKRGAITGDNVRIRAGTELFNWTRVQDHYAVQVRLSRGETVDILGQTEEFYRIAPPKGAVLYVSDKYVGQPGGEIAAVPESLPAENGVERVVPPPTEADKAMEQMTAAVQAFDALEAKLKAEYEKPAAERDLRKLLAEYKAIDTKDKPFLKPYVDARVAFLDSAVKSAQERRVLDEVLSNTAAKQREYEAAVAKIEVVPPPNTPVTTYTVKGILAPSAVFSGGPYARKRFVVRDPSNFRILAYAQATGGQIELPQYVGKEVQILGDGQYDKQLDAEVVEVKQVTVIKGDARLPALPEPIVKPLPGKEAPPDAAPQEPPPKPAEPAPPKALPDLKSEKPAEAPPKAAPEDAKPAPEAKPAEPKAAPAPESSGPVRPDLGEPAPAKSDDKPLPPTGLPVVDPAKRGDAKPPVNEKEFE